MVLSLRWCRGQFKQISRIEERCWEVIVTGYPPGSNHETKVLDISGGNNNLRPPHYGSGQVTDSESLRFGHTHRENLEPDDDIGLGLVKGTVELGRGRKHTDKDIGGVTKPFVDIKGTHPFARLDLGGEIGG